MSSKDGRGITLKSIFWRIWLTGSLGWLIIIGLGAGSTTVRYNDLSTDILRLESEVKKLVPGSVEWSDANRRLRKARHGSVRAEQGLIRSALEAFLPPLGILVLAFFLSLMLPSRDDDEADTPPPSDKGQATA